MKNFAGLPFYNFKVRKTYDFCKVPAYIIFKVFNKVHPLFTNFYCDCGLNKVDIYHFFNTIALSRIPWVVTYETAIPRYGRNLEFDLRLLAQDSCKKIIAISDRAIAAQKFFLNKFPEYKDRIYKKIIKLSPSQELYVDSVKDKSYEGEIVFTLAGDHFFRKGGLELLNVFQRLIDERYPVKLNIISSLQIGGHKDAHITKYDMNLALAKINKYSGAIRYYKALPNNEVIKIFKQSHIGLLPSYAETYGYSALEAMACGCPVIATNIPPIPEFIQKEFGWLIDVPQVAQHGTYTSDVESPWRLKEFSKKLTEGLYLTIKKICEGPSIIREKAIKAIENIKENHNPIKAVNILEDIYKRSI